MQKIANVGLIGCGHIAETYFRAHKYFNNFKIIKCADINHAASKKCAKTYGIKALSVSEIFMHSSNIGIMKMAELLGDDTIYKKSRNFGFGMTTGIRLPSETPGKLRPLNDWSGFSGRMVSIGQELSTSNLQIATSYCAIANGGYLVKPYVVKSIGDFNVGQNYPKVIRKVMSSNTASELLIMLEDVVVSGTGTNAYIPGFRVGGKTGTAEKFIDGSYSKREFISSFASIFPVDDPKYVCIVSVDSPLYGFHWGNETAAPIVKNIYSRIINDKEERGGENEQAQDKQGHDDQFDRDGASRGREWRWRGLIHVAWFSFASRTRRRWLSFKRLLGRDGDSACPVEGADQGQQPAFLDTGVDAAAIGGSTRPRLQLHEGG